YRTGSSAGPNPDIVTLFGLRLAIASETEENGKIATARVKQMTGNDSMRARSPHDKYEIEFRPSHTLFLLTNHKPHAPADDFAFWERVFLIPFNLSFVNREPQNGNERKADPHLSQKFDKELPGILAWMVKGCLEYQRYGLQAPAVVKDAVESYRRDEDIVADFLDDCCVVRPECSVGASEIYDTFKEWWKANISNKPPSQPKFGRWLKRRFESRKTPNVKYFGVGLLATKQNSIN
ncbi:MAG: DNA primase, partial [Desulfobacteraceae bacterium]|nr:DNA primase [Desulfobacteraceae bacterium]